MTVLKMKWRTDDHFNAIKKGLKRLKETDYIIIIEPEYDLKILRKLGFTVHKVKVKNCTYDERGYYRRKTDRPAELKVIKTKNRQELNFLKLVHPESIKDYAQVCEIREHINF